MRRLQGGPSPADLLRFFVFDRRRGQKEGEEIDKILFFFPEDVPFREQQSLLGLSDGLLTFTRIFSPDFPCESMHGDKHRHFFYRCEHDIWMVLVLEKGVYGAADGSTRDDAIQAVLREAYRFFVLFNGSISSLLEAYGPSADVVRSRLRGVLPDYISMFIGSKKLRLPTPADGLYERGAIRLMHMDLQTYMTAQSLVNMLETSFGGETVRYTMLLFDDRLIWSSLPTEDTATLYSYTCLRMIPSVIHRGSSTTAMLSSALTSAARGLKKKASSMSGMSSVSTTPLAKSAPPTPTRHMQFSGPRSMGATSFWNNSIGAGYAEPLSPSQQSSFAGSPEDSGVSQGERSGAECGAVGASTPAVSPPSLVRSDTCASDASVDMRPCMDSPGTSRPLKPRSWSCDDNGFLESSAWSSGAGNVVQGIEVREGQGGAEVSNDDRKGNGVPVVYVNGGELLQLLAYQYKNLTLLMLLPSLPLIASAARGLIRDQLLDKIVNRLESLESVLSENWPRPNAAHIPGYRYLCFDRGTKVVQSSPAGKITTLSKDSLCLLNQVRAEIDGKRLTAERSGRANTGGKQGTLGDVELCVRGTNNCWVVMRREGERELYTVMEKAGETLALTSEAINQLSNRFFDGVFTVD